MRIISKGNNNTNTDTLNIHISESMTINTLLDCNKEVLEFFSMSDNYTPRDILEYLDSIDGLDAGAIRNPGSLLIDNDTVLEFTLFGSTENIGSTRVSGGEEECEETGTVTVTVSGSFAHKNVAVTNNVTRVGDLITDNLADFFATTRCALSNMSVRINDVEAASTDTVKSGDVVTFEVRKAGSKGALFKVTVLRNGNMKSYACCPGDTLQTFLDNLSATLQEEVTARKYNGKFIPSAFYVAVLKHTVMNDGDVVVLADSEEKNDQDEYEEDAFDGYDVECAEAEDRIEDANDEHDCDHEKAVGSTVGSVTVVLPGGFNKIKIAISNGSTHVNDVVMSSKVWDALAMNTAQIASLIFHVNDVEVSLEDSLEDGDVISISARKAGSKGC